MSTEYNYICIYKRKMAEIVNLQPIISPFSNATIKSIFYFNFLTARQMISNEPDKVTICAKYYRNETN